jgi:WD40 repeat protein
VAPAGSQESVAATAIGRVRSVRDRTQIVGIGVLVGPNEFLTCAHVVNTALGCAQNDGTDKSGAVVTVEFINAERRPVRDGKVVAWAPPAGQGMGPELAGLRFDEPLASDQAQPARLSVDSADDRPLRVFGYPTQQVRPDGAWVLLRRKGLVAGTTLLQVDSMDGEVIKAQPGFSGSPVWDAGHQNVLGILVAAAVGAAERDAYVVPPSFLAEKWEDQLGYVSLPSNPYPGLMPFSPEQSDLFFGRQGDAAELARWLRTSQRVAVVGNSGAGKSSLVNAGLAPALRRRSAGTGAEERDWVVSAFRPGRDPLMALAAALATALADGTPPTRGDIARVEATLREHGLIQVLRPLLVTHRLLLVVDQLEEVFGQATTPDLELFSDLLLADDPADDRVTIVVTVLADVYYGRMARSGVPFAGFKPFALSPMTKEQRKEAIEKPAQERGVRFESGLADQIAEDTSEDSLPLMQFVLSELWPRQRLRTLRRGDYEAMGGVAGFIDRFADAQAAGLLRDEEPALRRALVALITTLTDPQGHPIHMRRRLLERDADAEVWAVVQQLARARLVTIAAGDEGVGGSYAELAHDRLIQDWRLLSDLSAEHHEFLVWLSRIMAYEAEGARLPEAWIPTAKKRLENPPAPVPRAVVEFVDRQEAELAARREELEDALRDAHALRLASEAELVLRSPGARPGLAVALSVESVLIHSTWQGQAAVRRALDVHRRTLGQLGAGEPVTGFAVDRERTTLLALGGPVRLCDGTTGATVMVGDPALRVAVGAFDRDASRLVVACDDRTVRLMRCSDLAELDAYAHDRTVKAVAIAPDGGLVMSGSKDFSTRMLDSAQHLCRVHRHGKAVNAVAMSPDGRLTAAGSSDGAAVVLDPSSLSVVSAAPLGSKVTSVEFSPDSGRLLTATETGWVYVLEAATGDVVRKWERPGAGLVVGFHPEGKLVGIVSPVEGSVGLYDVDSGDRVMESVMGTPVTALSFDPSGEVLAVAGEDGSAFVATTSGEHVVRFSHDASVVDVVLLAGGTRLATVTADQRAWLYDLSPVGSPVARCDVGSPICELRAIGPTGRQAATVSLDVAMRVFDVESSRLGEPQYQQPGFSDAALSKDGSLVATAGEPAVARLARTDTAEPAREPHRGPGRAIGVDLSDDGAWFLSAWTDGRVRLTGLQQHGLEWLHPRVLTIAASPSGRFVVSGALDGSLLLRTTPAGGVQPLPAMDAPVTALCFAENDCTLAVATQAGLVRLTDVTTGTPLADVDVGATVGALRFAPDGSLLAVGCADHTLRLIDVGVSVEVDRFEFAAPVTAVDFDRTGALVLGASLDATVRVFETDPAALVTRAVDALEAPLSPTELARFGIEESRLLATWQERQERLRNASGTIEGGGHR